MHYISLIILSLLSALHCQSLDGDTPSSKLLQEQKNDDCIVIDDICLSPWDVANYEAVRLIHSQLDDDHSGDIDLSESVEFLREELNYTKDVEKKQEQFHHNNDQHISVQELWNIWVNSEVYNWTTEQAVGWLSSNVELSQYSDAFYRNAVNGSVLPRLATNQDQFLIRVLGVKNVAHRSKISIKAMDVVLFGSPKDTVSLLKDLTIVMLVTFLVVGSIRFYQAQRNFTHQRHHMIQEMDALHEEERKFREELKQMEDQSKAAHVKTKSFNADVSSNENLNEEQEDGACAGGVEWGLGDDADCITRDGMTPGSPLQMWLQLTYEKEKCAFEAKCQLLEAQLREAKEMAERLKPSKKQIFVALGLVHGKTEPKYEAITDAVRESICQIKLMHKEKEYRWDTIEKLTGLDITNNPGINHLEFLLEPELQCPSKASSSSAIGLRSHALKTGSTLRDKMHKKKSKRNGSPTETGSIRSVSSFASRESGRTFGTIHQSNTIASGLGNPNSDNGVTEANQSAEHPVIVPMSNGKQLKKQDTEPSLNRSDVLAASVGSAKVSKPLKPFLKSFSQDANDGSPITKHTRKLTATQQPTEAAVKCKSEPSLELDAKSIASDSTDIGQFSRTESRKTKRLKFPTKFFTLRGSKKKSTPAT